MTAQYSGAWLFVEGQNTGSKTPTWDLSSQSSTRTPVTGVKKTGQYSGAELLSKAAGMRQAINLFLSTTIDNLAADTQLRKRYELVKRMKVQWRKENVMNVEAGSSFIFIDLFYQSSFFSIKIAMTFYIPVCMDIKMMKLSHQYK